MTLDATLDAPPRHVVVLCHPASDSFNAAVAARYCAAVAECGQVAVLRDLYRMEFDPIMRASDQPGAADFAPCPRVAEERALIADATVVVFVYPIWFGTPPAMLKGYVERVFGADVAWPAARAPGSRSRLAGKHLLSLTSSGNSRVWLDEQGQWQSLIAVFDHYLRRAFAMASAQHVHFPSIIPGLNDRFFAQNMAEVGDAARKACRMATDAQKPPIRLA